MQIFSQFCPAIGMYLLKCRIGFLKSWRDYFISRQGRWARSDERRRFSSRGPHCLTAVEEGLSRVLPMIGTSLAARKSFNYYVILPLRTCRLFILPKGVNFPFLCLLFWLPGFYNYLRCCYWQLYNIQESDWISNILISAIIGNRLHLQTSLPSDLK